MTLTRFFSEQLAREGFALIITVAELVSTLD